MTRSALWLGEWKKERELPKERTDSSYRPVTTVLPPDHPSIDNPDKDTCPVTKATISHHKVGLER